jgi:hypothetical protein
VLQAVAQLGEFKNRRNLVTITAQLAWDVFVSPLELTVVDGRNDAQAAPGFGELPPGVQYEPVASVPDRTRDNPDE